MSDTLTREAFTAYPAAAPSAAPRADVAHVSVHGVDAQTGFPVTWHVTTLAEDGLVLREEVRGGDADLGERLEQRGQVLADARDRFLAAEDEPHHELAVGRLGDQEVLELAAAAGHVVRGEVRVREERGERGERGAQARGVERAVAQVDAEATGTAEGSVDT